MYPHSPSLEGIPVLQGCVGAISCRILGSIPLSQDGLTSAGWDLGSLALGGEKEGNGEATSELYVAEVVRLEDCQVKEMEDVQEGDRQVVGQVLEEGAMGLPLVYHDQRYVSVGSIGRS